MARNQSAQNKDAPRQSTNPPPTVHIPIWLPPTLFASLAVILFREFIFGEEMLFGSDTLGLGYVARAFYAEALTELGSFPRWAPLILGGTPFIEALASGDSLYPPSLLLFLLAEPYRALGWKLVLHVGLAGLFMFGWIRSIGASRSAALFGGTAYMLAPYLVSLVQPGHDGKIFVTALAPLMFWVVERHFVRPSVQTFTGIAFVVALVIYTTHFQMAYFLFGGTGLYAIFRSVQVCRSGRELGQGKNPKALRAASTTFGLFLGAALIGSGVAGLQLFPSVDYVMEHSRRIQTTREASGESGIEWSSSWSLHPEEVMALLIPEFAGNNSGGSDWSQGTYWGRNALKDNHESTGIVVLLFATMAFVGGRKRAFRIFFATLGALALLFALGTHTPLWRIFYELLPGIALFRAPSQVMFLFVFAISTLAALGLDRMLSVSRSDKTDWGPIMRLLLGAGALMGLLGVLVSSGALLSIWTSYIYPDIDAGRLARLDALQPFIERGAWTSFFLVLGASALVYASRRGLVASTGIVAGLVLLVIADEYRISSGFIQVIDFQEWSAADANEQAILDQEAEREEPYRLLSFRRNGQDVHPALHGIELAAGHHPNDLSRYRELIGMVGSGLPMNLLDEDIRRLLNVEYILWPDYQFGQSLGDLSVLSRTQLQDGTPYETVHRVRGLPRARLVGSATVKQDAEAVGYMLSSDFDPVREVVLPEPPPIALDGEPVAGSVVWQERTINRQVLSVSSDRPALLVISDNWFPAWRANIDGIDTPIIRAYHTLRAVPVDAGSHTVEMVYESDVVRRSFWLSIILLLSLSGTSGYHFWREKRAGRNV